MAKIKKVTNYRAKSGYQTLSLSNEDELFELIQNILMPYIYTSSLTLAHIAGVSPPNISAYLSYFKLPWRGKTEGN